MTEPNANPAEPAKTVPVADVIAVKAKLKDVQSELERERHEKATLAEQLKALEVDLSDAEGQPDEAKIKAAKRELLKKHSDIERRESTLRDRETGLTKRERQIQAKELASTYKVDADLLLTAEDMEKEALKLAHERLSKNPNANAGREIYETGAPPVAKKSPLQMTSQEFAEHKKRLAAQTAGKR